MQKTKFQLLAKTNLLKVVVQKADTLKEGEDDDSIIMLGITAKEDSSTSATELPLLTPLQCKWRMITAFRVFDSRSRL